MWLPPHVRLSRAPTKADKIQVELNRRYAFRANSVYRPGDSLHRNGKHYICNKEVVSGWPARQRFWRQLRPENYVHMQTGNQGTGYNA